MVSNPLVSVCVVTYNHKDYITKCLEGILMQQTDFPFEIIIGEDESTDGSREICKAFAQKYPDRIKLFLRSRKDVIYIDGRPTGRFNFIESVKEAKGKFIALCEGDDYWTDPIKLQKQVDLLMSNNNLIACHHWQRVAIKVDGSYIEKKAPKDGHGYYPKKTAMVSSIFTNDLRLKLRTVMFRNVLDENFFPDWFREVAFGDVPLSFLLGKYGDFGFIDEEMAVYRHTGSGVSTSGLKQLGRKKFTLQHYKNWIEIWDYADKEYQYQYHAEAVKTVSDYYNTILVNSPTSLGSLYDLLYYNLFERKLSFVKTFPHTKLIFGFYRKKLTVVLKRNILGR